MSYAKLFFTIYFIICISGFVIGKLVSDIIFPGTSSMIVAGTAPISVPLLMYYHELDQAEYKK